MARCLALKVTSVVLCLLIITATAPFSLAETIAGSPLGAVVTPGKVTIGNVAVPTGTTVFTGDRVVAREAPAAINFSSGSRLEMTKAAASFAREGNTLVLSASEGLLRFNFKKGESVRINAGRYSLTSAGNGTAHIGQLGVNRNGQVGLAMREGTFVATHTGNGERVEVTPGAPFIVLDQSGQASLTRGGKALSDSTKTWLPNELKGKCVEAGGESQEITGNTATTITIKGQWKLTTGSYDYRIKDCSQVAGAAAAGAGAAGAGAAAGMSGATLAIITIAGVAGAAGLAVGIHEAVKSDSSR